MSFLLLNRTASVAIISLITLPSFAQTPDVEILVIGTPTSSGLGMPIAKVPFSVQSVGAAELQSSQSLDLSDYMNSNMGSVSINSAQNNPLQNDVQFRGFTASPLLGLPQGLAVYQNGARINEPLGDAVNWDLLPESAIATMTLIGGANPLFGLNTLGGALAITMKNGFNFQGHSGEFSTGSWNRHNATLESGGNNGSWGYYANLSAFREDGWRDMSASESQNFYGGVSWRDGTRSTVDLGLQLADSDLTGNGSSPVGLLDIDREAIFTAPDITENDLTMFNLNGSHFITDDVQFAGSAFRRRNNSRSFNGDASEFSTCEFSGGTSALFEEADEIEELLDDELGIELHDICNGSDATITSFADLEDYISDRANSLGLDPDDFELDNIIDDLSGSGVISDEAINNISRRRQTSTGYDAQLSFLRDAFGRGNRLTVGASYLKGESTFASVTELAMLDQQTRSTEGLGTGSFFDEAETDIATHTVTSSVYFTDTLDLSNTIAVTISGRYNDSDVRLRDQSGERPELNGDHEFSRFNPSIGITFQQSEDLTIYASYNESNRIPTPIELSCNDSVFELAQQFAEENGDDPDDIEFECRLPNAFLADPPLDDVVTRNIETGLRGHFNDIVFSAGVFHAINRDDILFQTTGRSTGLFANVDQTQRMGFESMASGTFGSVDWFGAYSFVKATFEDDFAVLSPNHDFTNDDGEIDVSAGNSIPGIPRHQFKAGLDWHLNDNLSVGLDALYNSSQYLRGDESNQLGRIDGYSIFNLRASYQANDKFVLFAKVSNLLDTEYENFGLLGEEPDEVIDFLTDNSPVFLGAGAPRSIIVGARVNF